MARDQQIRFYDHEAYAKCQTAYEYREVPNSSCFFQEAATDSSSQAECQDDYKTPQKDKVDGRWM